MGEALRVGFDKSLKMEFHRAKVTTIAGLLPYRELDEVPGLAEVAIPRRLFAAILERIPRLRPSQTAPG